MSERSRAPQKKKRKKSKKQDPVAFWGDEKKLPDPTSSIDTSPDSLAVVRSLGTAPIPGTPAEPYFALVYERAAGLATVLGHIVSSDDAAPAPEEQ